MDYQMDPLFQLPDLPDANPNGPLPAVPCLAYQEIRTGSTPLISASDRESQPRRGASAVGPSNFERSPQACKVWSAWTFVFKTQKKMKKDEKGTWNWLHMHQAAWRSVNDCWRLLVRSFCSKPTVNQVAIPQKTTYPASSKASRMIARSLLRWANRGISNSNSVKGKDFNVVKQRIIHCKLARMQETWWEINMICSEASPCCSLQARAHSPARSNMDDVVVEREQFAQRVCLEEDLGIGAGIQNADFAAVNRNCFASEWHDPCKFMEDELSTNQFINPSAACLHLHRRLVHLQGPAVIHQRWEGLTWKASHQQIVIRDILHHSNVTLASGSRRSTVVLPPGSWAPYPQVRDESSSYTTLWHACWSRTQIHIDLPGWSTKPYKTVTNYNNLKMGRSLLGKVRYWMTHPATTQHVTSWCKPDETCSRKTATSWMHSTVS